MSPVYEQGTGEGLLSYRYQLIANKIQLLQAVPVESNHTTVLCWPLAILDAYAEEAQHREFVRNYILRMVENYKLGNMYQVFRLVDFI
jgi:hypothetical protein